MTSDQSKWYWISRAPEMLCLGVCLCLFWRMESVGYWATGWAFGLAAFFCKTMREHVVGPR